MPFDTRNAACDAAFLLCLSRTIGMVVITPAETTVYFFHSQQYQSWFYIPTSSEPEWISSVSLYFSGRHRETLKKAS